MQNDFQIENNITFNVNREFHLHIEFMETTISFVFTYCGVFRVHLHKSAVLVFMINKELNTTNKYE